MVDILSLNAATRAKKDASQALLLARGVAYRDELRPVGDRISFVKLPSNPILELDDTDLPSLYWPVIVRVDGFLENPLGRYYMWLSTDHASATGRVALAYSDDLITWTYHGVVFQLNAEGGSGNETETPKVVIDEAAGVFRMFHQQQGPTGAVASQVTMSATSPDGLTWTSEGIALDIPDANTWPAPAHLGYFAPQRIGQTWIGYSLLRGTNNCLFALSKSVDGAHWEIDPTPLGWGAEYLDSNHRIEWNTSNVVRYQGETLWVGLISEFFSGTQRVVRYWAIAPLAEDWRSFTGAPRKLFDPTQSWETSFMSEGHLFVDEGRLILVYRSGDGTPESPTAFGIAITEALA